MKTADKKKRIIENILYPIGTVVAIILVWWLVSAIVNIPLFFPTPWEIVKELGNLFAKGEFYVAIGGTLVRALISFVIAFVFGVGLASVSALHYPVYRVLRPIVVILRAIPTMSVILLSVLWLDSFWSPVLIGFLIVFPLIYTGTYEGIGEIDKDLIVMSKLYKVSKKDMLTKLFIPSVTPTILTTSKSAVSLNVKVIIAAEVIALTATSIGRQMQYAKVYLEVSVLFAWTIIAIILAFLLEGVVSLIQRKVKKHYDRT